MYDNILIYIPRNVAIKYCYLDKTDEKRCAFAHGTLSDYLIS